MANPLELDSGEVQRIAIRLPPGRREGVGSYDPLRIGTRDLEFHGRDRDRFSERRSDSASRARELPLIERAGHARCLCANRTYELVFAAPHRLRVLESLKPETVKPDS